jgi:nucleoside-diphosphate-sugar epimerase
VNKELSLLIIGGTGFFGKSILDSFKRGLLNDFNITKILVLARNTDKFKLEFPELFFNGVDLINGDISTIKILPFADYVIHAATSTNMSNYIDEEFKSEYTEKSVENYCKLAPIFHSNSKILYCSSGAVYGKQPLDLENIDESYPFQKDLSSFSIEKKNYCIIKRNSEDLIIKLATSGLEASIARCFAFYGKYLPKNQHYAYGNFIGQAEKGETITVNTTGTVYRSYMSADELVKSLLLLGNVASSDCPIYNVGSDRQISLYDLAEKVAQQYGVECEFINYNSDIVVDRYVPNVDKLKHLIRQYNKSVKL